MACQDCCRMKYKHKDYKGLKVCRRASEISHLSCADDSFLFFKQELNRLIVYYCIKSERRGNIAKLQDSSWVGCFRQFMRSGRGATFRLHSGLYSFCTCWWFSLFTVMEIPISPPKENVWGNIAKLRDSYSTSINGQHSIMRNLIRT